MIFIEMETEEFDSTAAIFFMVFIEIQTVDFDSTTAILQKCKL